MTRMSRLSAAFAATASPAVAMAADGSLLSMLSHPMLIPLAVAGAALIWRLQKKEPKEPKEIVFPLIELLMSLEEQERKPVSMPLWQKILAVSSLVTAAAVWSGPQWSPDAAKGDGPLLIVVDNGWVSGAKWAERVKEISAAIDQAGKNNRPVMLLPTAPSDEDGHVRLSQPMNADEARAALDALKPQPYAIDRDAAREALAEASLKASVLWLADGTDNNALHFAEVLKTVGPVTVVRDDRGPHLLMPPTGQDLEVKIRRLDTAQEESVSLIAQGADSDVVTAIFAAGQSEATARFNLPPQIQNGLESVSLQDESSAGAMVLLDEGSRRRPVGIVGERNASLLDENRYITAALGEESELHFGTVEELLKNDLAVLILPDSAVTTPEAREKIAAWVAEGHTLLRFAGPNLAASDMNKDSLLPVPLSTMIDRDAALVKKSADNNGAKIAPVAEKSLLVGVGAAPDNVSVTRQILAKPGPELEERVLVRLQDQSPLVTADTRDKGRVVLVHTTANTEWTTLPLSSFFQRMLREIVRTSSSLDGPAVSPVAMPPLKTLSGTGLLQTPPAAARALTPQVARGGKVDFRNPPGFYGTETLRYAYNLAGSAAIVEGFKPMPTLPDGISVRGYEDGQKPSGWAGYLLAGALMLMMLDQFVFTRQRGPRPAPRKDPAPQYNRP